MTSSSSSPCTSCYSVSCDAKSGESYIGSVISITSMYEIRYQGVLYHINPRKSTIGLKNVRCYGTEGRKKDGRQIPPSDKVYEYILFHGSNIKDLQVQSPSPAQKEEKIHNDPAIIQSHYSPLSSSASVGGRTLKESVLGQATPALTTRACSSAMPSYQSVNYAGSPNLCQDTHNAGPSFSTPVYSQGYDASSVSKSSQNSMVSSPLPAQYHMQAPESKEPPFMQLKSPSECITPVSTVAAHPLNCYFPSSLEPVQFTFSSDMLSFSSLRTPVPSHAASTSVDRSTMSSSPVSIQDTSRTEAPIVAKAVADPIAVYPTQSVPYPTPSCGSSTSSSVLTPLPTLLTPNQLSLSRSPVLSSTQKLYPDQKDAAVLTPLLSMSPPLLSNPGSQPPLLPLPGSVQQHKYLTSQFTEEFDFEAMNEKFKKDEVWSYLGKAKQRERTEGIEDNTTDQSLVDKETPGLVPNFDPKPAYRKDEFFDTISCNRRNQGRNGQNLFSERMKLDSETFGNLHHRTNLGYGGYGSGHGDSYHTSSGRGRGSGYHGRGRGYMAF